MLYLSESIYTLALETTLIVGQYALNVLVTFSVDFPYRRRLWLHSSEHRFHDATRSHTATRSPSPTGDRSLSGRGTRGGLTSLDQMLKVRHFGICRRPK